jgi:hypothetical protein
MGTVALASSELGPMICIRFGVVASIFWAAGTASAGSPRLSTTGHWMLVWPRMPPAEAIDLAAAGQPALISGPKLASAPVNGLNVGKTSGFPSSL